MSTERCTATSRAGLTCELSAGHERVHEAGGPRRRDIVRWVTRQPAATRTPIDAILGRAGEPPTCRIVTKDVDMHWYPTEARAGDPCFCGKVPRRDFDHESATRALPTESPE